jgi:hypothetical protein
VFQRPEQHDAAGGAGGLGPRRWWENGRRVGLLLQPGPTSDRRLKRSTKNVDVRYLQDVSFLPIRYLQHEAVVRAIGVHTNKLGEGPLDRLRLTSKHDSLAGDDSVPSSVNCQVSSPGTKCRWLSPPE